ncbi:MAG: hypothetical protein GY711_06665 [bacterium]|nr:hypothetical protein [bacterium]
MRSIRAYLLRRLCAGVALLLLAAGFGVFVVFTRSMEGQFDLNLTDRVQALASILIQAEEDEVEVLFSDELMPEYDPVRDDPEHRPAYFELWYDDGRLLEASESLEGKRLAIAPTPGMEPQHWTAVLPDGREGRYVVQRVVVHHVYPEEGPDRPTAAKILIVVARGREDLVAAERMVLIYCTIAALVLIAAIVLLARQAVERGLAPANRLGATLDAIQVEDLPERLDVGPVPAELVPVAEKVDALIQRLAVALERERRTSADIAHELRTPISELLTLSEVHLRNGRSNGNGKDGAHEALGTVRDVAWRMGHSVSTLLKLARLETGSETFENEPVDVGAVLVELLRPHAANQRARELRVHNDVEPDETVDGDEDALRIVLSNLIGNATHYSPTGGTVRIALERDDAGWRLHVENAAPGLAPADIDTLTQPFWRKDRARADREHAGLGLALSRALADRVDLDLSFRLEDGVFRASLGTLVESRPGG